MRAVSISTRSSQDEADRGCAAAIPAHRHQPFADIGAGRDRHPQALRGVLVHIAPVGAEQKTALGFTEAARSRNTPSRIRYDTPRARRELRGQQLQQRRLARAGLAHDRQHLAG